MNTYIIKKHPKVAEVFKEGDYVITKGDTVVLVTEGNSVINGVAIFSGITVYSEDKSLIGLLHNNWNPCVFTRFYGTITIEV